MERETLGNEIELISDGAGLAVIGDPADVELFLTSVGLPSTDCKISRLGTALTTGSSAAQAASEIAAGSGRWLKLTKESADKVKQFGLMDSTTPGVSHAMVGKPGEIKQWIQVVKGPGSMASNPAILAGAAGIMAQLAMQQTMSEITDYLARIDEKLDDVLRAQTNQVLARMDGVDLAVREAMTVRESVGRVSEVTWSKVQTSSSTILETQGYALRQLADLADKLEGKHKVSDLADTAKEAEVEVQKLLSILARCFQLHDAIAVLELDRVLDASPDELDLHRLGLKAARADRLELISQTTGRLLTRMTQAVGTANSKVLFNPVQSPAIVASSNRVAIEVGDFHELLGIHSGRESSEARRWKDAAAERWDKARETGAGSVDTVKRYGSETRDQARSVRGKLAGRIAERKLWRGGNDAEGDQTGEDEA